MGLSEFAVQNPMTPTCGDEYAARSKAGCFCQHDSTSQHEPNSQHNSTCQDSKTIFDSSTTSFDPSIFRTEIEAADIKECGGGHNQRNRETQSWQWILH
jgi:hypothetical protein